MLGDVEHQKALGSNLSDCMAVLAGTFAAPLALQPRRSRRNSNEELRRCSEPASPTAQ
jgi:hypothetical protein